MKYILKLIGFMQDVRLSIFKARIKHPNIGK